MAGVIWHIPLRHPPAHMFRATSNLQGAFSAAFRDSAEDCGRLLLLYEQTGSKRDLSAV
jgi:hypothetical protein